MRKEISFAVAVAVKRRKKISEAVEAKRAIVSSLPYLISTCSTAASTCSSSVTSS